MGFSQDALIDNRGIRTEAFAASRARKSGKDLTAPPHDSSLSPTMKSPEEDSRVSPPCTGEQQYCVVYVGYRSWTSYSGEFCTSSTRWEQCQPDDIA